MPCQEDGLHLSLFTSPLHETLCISEYSPNPSSLPSETSHTPSPYPLQQNVALFHLNLQPISLPALIFTHPTLSLQPPSFLQSPKLLSHSQPHPMHHPSIHPSILTQHPLSISETVTCLLIFPLLPCAHFLSRVSIISFATS